MAEDEDWVDPNDWQAPEKPKDPEDPNDWVDPTYWQENQPKENLKKTASALTAETPSASVGYTGDLLKSAGIGLLKGPIYATGAGGDIGSLVSAGARKVGLTDEQVEKAKRVARVIPGAAMFQGPTSRDVQEAVESVTGPLYEPKTKLGRSVSNIASLTTNPLTYAGPGGIGTKLVTALGAGIGSEAAGAATEGTKYEVPARIVGAIAGGATPAAIEAALKKAPGFGEFLRVGDAQYDAAHNLGIQFDQSAVFRLSKDIDRKLRAAHFRPSNAPNSFSTLDELAAPPPTIMIGQNQLIPAKSSADIHGIKGTLKNISRGRMDEWPNGSPDYKAAQLVRREIDKFLTSGNQNAVVQNAGSLNDFVRLYGDANKNYGVGLNLQRIDKKLAQARNATAAADALKPYNAQRQKINQVLNNEGQRKWYTPEQQEQMNRIVEGTRIGNAGRFFGRAAPRGFFSVGAPSLAAYLSGHWEIPLATGIVGETGRQVANASNAHQISKLQEMIRQGSPAYRSGSLAPTPGIFPGQALTPFPYLANLPREINETQESQQPQDIIPPENQKEIDKALDIAKQLRGASGTMRRFGGRIPRAEGGRLYQEGYGRYTEDELEASRREDRRFMEIISRLAPHGIPWRSYRPSQNIEDRSNENMEDVSGVERLRRRFAPNREPPPPITDMSLQAGYDDIGKASGGVVEPTEAQKKAGNYKKDHISIHGLPITIENRRGTLRRGIDKNGKPWHVRMPAHYGYFKRSEGADGDHVDCYVGPFPHSESVTVIDQKDADSNRFDEHKCMLGFANKEQALMCYKRGFSDGRGHQRIGAATEMNINEFKDWLKNGDTTERLIKRRRGGRIRRVPPTVTIPESAATLKKQQQALIAGKRKAMLYPHPAAELALPRGMRRMKTKDGLIHFDPKKLTPSQIRKASDQGKMNELLDLGPVSKEEALARTAKGELPLAVTERGPDGVEAKAAFGTDKTAPDQIAAFEETADPSSIVGVEPVPETLARRVA